MKWGIGTMEHNSGIYSHNFDPQADDIYQQIDIEAAYRALISPDYSKKTMIAVINLRRLQDRKIYRKRIMDYIKGKK